MHTLCESRISMALASLVFVGLLASTHATPTAISSTSTCTFDVQQNSSSSASMFGATLRDDTGTINGPLPVQPNAPHDQYDYDEPGYIRNFKKLQMGWVRFQDLGMTQGGTSLTQMFLAWPLTDDALTSANVTELTSDPKNFNFTSLDRELTAALAAGSNIDYRIGDSHQIAALYAAGEPVPVGDKQVVFPKDSRILSQP